MKKPVISTDLGALIIASAVIGAFIYFTYEMVQSNNFTFDNFRDIASIWGVWVGIVIGYFFGSRKVETLTEKIENFFQEMDFTTGEIEDDYHELEDEYNKTKDLYDNAKQELQYLVAKNPQLDKELLERLKNEHNIII